MNRTSYFAPIRGKGYLAVYNISRLRVLGSQIMYYRMPFISSEETVYGQNPGRDGNWPSRKITTYVFYCPSCNSFAISYHEKQSIGIGIGMTCVFLLLGMLLSLAIAGIGILDLFFTDFSRGLPIFIFGTLGAVLAMVGFLATFFGLYSPRDTYLANCDKCGYEKTISIPPNYELNPQCYDFDSYQKSGVEQIVYRKSGEKTLNLSHQESG
jgi:hypothetical protein